MSQIHKLGFLCIYIEVAVAFLCIKEANGQCYSGEENSKASGQTMKVGAAILQ